MDTFERSVLVYDYESWDPESGQMKRSDLPAMLEAIRSGLGIPILSSGRKVPADAVDSLGMLKREARAAD